MYSHPACGHTSEQDLDCGEPCNYVGQLTSTRPATLCPSCLYGTTEPNGNWQDDDEVKISEELADRTTQIYLRWKEYLSQNATAAEDVLVSSQESVVPFSQTDYNDLCEIQNALNAAANVLVRNRPKSMRCHGTDLMDLLTLLAHITEMKDNQDCRAMSRLILIHEEISVYWAEFEDLPCNPAPPSKDDGWKARYQWAVAAYKARIARTNANFPPVSIQNLPEDKQDCMICLESYNDGCGDPVRVPCGVGHIFGRECIFEYMRQDSAKCPMCRGKICSLRPRHHFDRRAIGGTDFEFTSSDYLSSLVEFDDGNYMPTPEWLKVLREN